MQSLLYVTLACVAFWVVLASLAPTLAAWLLIGGAVGLALVATFPRSLRDPDCDREVE